MKSTEGKMATMRNVALLMEAWKVNDFEPEMCTYKGIDGRAIYNLNIGAVNPCGSCCCIIGYAPSVRGLEITLNDFDRYRGFCYRRYSSRIFPYLTDNAWGYMFGASWANDRLSAIERMEYMLNNDLTPPNNWHYEIGYF